MHTKFFRRTVSHNKSKWIILLVNDICFYMQKMERQKKQSMITERTDHAPNFPVQCTRNFKKINYPEDQLTRSSLCFIEDESKAQMSASNSASIIPFTVPFPGINYDSFYTHTHTPLRLQICPCRLKSIYILQYTFIRPLDEGQLLLAQSNLTPTTTTITTSMAVCSAELLRTG